MSDLIEAKTEPQEEVAAVSSQAVNSSPKPEPSPIDSYTPKVAMAIHAHPDDQEFSAAGTLAKWARAGTQVISVIITNGDAGNNDPDKDETYKPILAKLREGEQRAANDIIGIKETVFMGYPDGTLVPSIELRRDLTRLIRKYKPDVVVSGDPTSRFFGNSYINHPDHRAAADVACDAVFPSAGSRPIFPELLHEGYEPHNVRYFYMHGSEKTDIWVDISTTIAVKVEALRQHKSQLGEWDVNQAMREWASSAGKEKGLEFAESFRRMVLIEEG
jgi:LmbE family N-acetylglucosaminyl deacetylase